MPHSGDAQVFGGVVGAVEVFPDRVVILQAGRAFMLEEAFAKRAVGFTYIEFVA